MQEGQSPEKRTPDATEPTTALVSLPDPLQLAWAAGFVDGEACIHIAKQRYAGRATCSYRLGVHIAQNDRSVLEHLRDVVGIPAPIFPVKKASNHTRQCYTLNYTGKHALSLLRLLRGFLQRKRLEAQAALDCWRSLKTDPPARAAIAQI